MKRIPSKTLVSIALALSAAACSNPADDAAKAKVEEVKPAAAVAPSAAVPAGEVINIDSVASTITWVGSKITGRHDGGFQSFTGKITLNNDDATASSVAIDIDATTIFADNDKLTGHLKSPDFFDVAQFPKATFVSDKISASEAPGSSHSVSGTLTMHGISKAITFPATIAVATDKITAQAEFAINRKEWGLVYPGKPDDLIRDEVVIKFNLVASRG